MLTATIHAADGSVKKEVEADRMNVSENEMFTFILDEKNKNKVFYKLAAGEYIDVKYID